MEPPSYPFLHATTKYQLSNSSIHCNSADGDWWWFPALASPLQSWGPCCLSNHHHCASSHHHFLPPSPPPATHTKHSTVRHYASQRDRSGLIGEAVVGPWLVVTCVLLFSSTSKVLGSNRGTMPRGKMDERIALQQLRRSSGLMKEETWFHCRRRTTIAAATF